MKQIAKNSTPVEKLISLINEKGGRPFITNYDIKNATDRPIGNINVKIESLMKKLEDNGEEVNRFFWRGEKDRGYQKISDPVYGMYEEGFYLWLMSVRDSDKDLGISAKTKLIKAFKEKDKEIKALRAQQAGLVGVFSAEPICKENILIKFAEALTYNAHLISEHKKEIVEIKKEQQEIKNLVQRQTEVVKNQSKIIETQTAEAKEKDKIIENQRISMEATDYIIGITPHSPSWRKSLNNLINKFGTAFYPGGAEAFRRSIYTEMSNRSEKKTIRWNARKNGYVSAMEKRGLKVNRDKVAYLDVIEANPVLKELYVTVAKERLLRLIKVYGDADDNGSKPERNN